jgi:hypothetical protein
MAALFHVNHEAEPFVTQPLAAKQALDKGEGARREGERDHNQVDGRGGS